MAYGGCIDISNNKGMKATGGKITIENGKVSEVYHLKIEDSMYTGEPDNLGITEQVGCYTINEYDNYISIESYSASESCPRDVEIPSTINNKNVEIIEDSAFDDWEHKITSVIIPNSVETIGSDAFAGNLLESVSIPNSVETISEYAFAENLLESVSISNSVETISEYAFAYNLLESVTIPNSVKTIKSNAFNYNKLESVEIGSGIISIEENAFGQDTDEVWDIIYGPNNIGTVNINAPCYQIQYYNQYSIFGNTTVKVKCIVVLTD